AADDAAAREDVVERLLGLRAAVRVDEVELPAALEPDAAGLRDDRSETVGIRELPVFGVQDINVLRAGLLPSPRAGGFLRVDRVARRCGNVDDDRVWPARGLNDPGVQLGTPPSSADDDHRAARRADLDRGVLGLECHGSDEGDRETNATDSQHCEPRARGLPMKKKATVWRVQGRASAQAWLDPRCRTRRWTARGYVADLAWVGFVPCLGM